MVNWVKRVEDFDGNQLESTETVEVVAFLQPAGAVAQSMAGGVGGLLGSLIGSSSQKKAANKRGDTTSPQTEAFPAQPLIVAITNKRIVAYKQNALSGKPNQFIRDVQFKDITNVEFTKGKTAHTLTVSFADGGQKSFDFPRGQKHEDFVEALKQHTK